jgi:4-amino-4-deoxy-L-arabinose transferase-like glycosyltransferase
MSQKISHLISKNRLELLLLALIFATGAFLRLYRIADYMTFLGDEGRDALVIKRILIDHHPTLIGPTTSVTTPAGHMYLGPLYYYLMLIPMTLTGLNPASAAVIVALFGLATLLLLWWTGRTWFSPPAGLTATLLYAISPTAITYSRSSWNPNIMPFFALLAIWSIWKIWQSDAPLTLNNHRHPERSFLSLPRNNSGVEGSPPRSATTKLTKKTHLIWFLLLAVSLAFALQSHYLGLLLIPPIALIWLLTAIRTFKYYPHQKRPFIHNTLYMILAFLILMSPLALFDFRHNFLNFNALKSFFTVRQTTVNLKFYKALPQVYPIFTQIIASLITAKNLLIAQMVSALITLTSSIYLLQSIVSRKNTGDTGGRAPVGAHSYEVARSTNGKETHGRTRIFSQISPAFLLLFLWLVTGVTGLGLYKQHIYDHYFGFLFPAVFLLTAWTINTLSLQAANLSSHINSRRGNPTGFLPFNILRKSSTFSITHPLLVIILTIPLIWVNLYYNPLRHAPNFQLQRTRQIAQTIVDQSQGQPFNLAMIAAQNYDAGYRFFLEKWQAPLVAIDPQLADTTITDQLFVICENQPPFQSREEDCNPLGHPQTEIAAFGWAQIDHRWSFPWGTTLYRLTHSQPSTGN